MGKGSTNGTRQIITAPSQRKAKGQESEWLCSVSHVGEVKLDGNRPQPWRRRRSEREMLLCPWQLGEKCGRRAERARGIGPP